MTRKAEQLIKSPNIKGALHTPLFNITRAEGHQTLMEVPIGKMEIDRN